MAQHDYTSLIVLAGAGALAYYGYQQGWFASLFPTTAAPTPLPTGTAPPPIANASPQLAPGISITNNTGTSDSTFRVGDNWTITVSGPPNSPVVSSSLFNGSPYGAGTAMGTTDATGHLVLTGTFGSGQIGSWAETWTVGGLIAGTLSFTVSGGASNQNTTPADLAALLTSTAGSGAQFGLDTDQWSYYYGQLQGRTAPTPAQVETMLANAGLTDATRSQVEDVNAFVGQLNSVGLTGLGYRGIPVGAIHQGRYA